MFKIVFKRKGNKSELSEKMANRGKYQKRYQLPTNTNKSIEM